MPPDLAADLAQEALLRLRGQQVRNARAWFRRVFAHLAASEARRMSPIFHRVAEPSGETDLDAIEASAALAPETIVLARQAEALTRGLPPPYAQIALLQYCHCATRAEVIAWLRAWRPVGVESCRKAMRECHRMLRLLGAGGDPRRVWPARYDARKNAWFRTPPPPIPPSSPRGSTGVGSGTLSEGRSQ